MDFPSTQVITDENEGTSTNRHNVSSQSEENDRRQVATLTIGSTEYPIYTGVNTIGRHPVSDISIADTTVSKHHSEIEATSQQAPAWISDLNSSNKTKLNNTILRPGRYYELKEGSIIDFGRIRATYRILQTLNASTVAETPVVDRRRRPLEERVIAATPDSSLNNSSGLAGDVSAIPATQDFRSTFRTPQLLHQQQPVQSLASTSFLTSSPRNDNFAEATSSTCDKNICPDSDDEASTSEVLSRNDRLHQNTKPPVQKHFCPDSDDEADANDTETRQREQLATSVTSTLHTESRNDSPVESFKAPLNRPSTSTGINIHDMETQQPDELINNLEARVAKTLPANCSEMQYDIHDVETQVDELVVEGRTKRLTVYSSGNSSPNRDSECRGQTSLYDMETQKPEDIINDASENVTKKLSQSRSEVSCNIHDMETQNEDFRVIKPRKGLIVQSPRIGSPDRDSECENKNNIYDMETQIPEETLNLVNDNATKKLSRNRSEIQSDIHDMETQIDDLVVDTREKPSIIHSPVNNGHRNDSEGEKQIDISDMETQKPEESIDRLNENATKILFRHPNGIQCDIHNMETQKEDFRVKSNRKTLIVHSPTNDNSDSNSETENGISIYDLETQKLLQQNGQIDDINSMETQKLFLNDAREDQANSNSRKEFATNTQIVKTEVDMKGISSPENEGNAEDIYEKETQCFALIMSASPSVSPEQINAQNDKVISESFLPGCDRQAETTNDSTSQMETQQIYGKDINCKVSESKLQNSENEQVAADPLNNDAALRNNTNCPDSLDNSTGPSEERLKLSLEANFEEDCKELDVSVGNLGSQNLLENFTDAEVHEDLNMTSPHRPLADASKELNQFAASSEEDDIFNAVTQKVSINEEDIFNAVTQRVTVKSRKNVENGFESDDSETDEEGVFLNIAANSKITAAKNTGTCSKVDTMISHKDNDAVLRFGTCETQKIVNKRQPDINASDSDDSITDEEGLFTQFVGKVKDSAGPSSIVQENDNCSRSQDSDDIYDLPTQPIKLSAEERTNFSGIVTEDEDETVIIRRKNYTSNGKATSIVTAKENALEIAEPQTAYNIDDVAPTQQIYASAAADSPRNSPSCYKENESTAEMSKKKKLKELEAELDIDDMAPTQVVRVLSNESLLSDADNLIMIETDSGNLMGNGVSSIKSQRCFKKNEGTSEILKENKSEELETVSDIDDMAPTQIIRVASNESPLSKANNLRMINTPSGNSREGDGPSTDSPPCVRENKGRFKKSKQQKPESPTSKISSDINDMGPTQIIYDPSTVSPLKNSADPLIFERDNNSKSKDDDAFDIDMAPTQIIRVPKEVCNSADSDDNSDDLNDDPSDHYSSQASGLYTAEKCDIEDIDYEMAPTQLITEVEAEGNKKSTNAKNVKKDFVKKSRGKTKRKAKVNLDDTIERNLNNMFDGVNTEEVEEPPMLSTQLLENVLRSSQDEKLSESTTTISKDVVCRNIVKESSGETTEEQRVIIDEIKTDSAREGRARETNTDCVEQICKTENTVLKKQSSNTSFAACDENNTRDDVKNCEITPLSAANDDMFDEYFTPNISESLVRPSIIIDDDDDFDIMAGLPEVAKQAQGVSGGSKASNQNSKRVSIGRKRSVPKKLENEQINTKTSNEAEVFKHEDNESKEDMGSVKRARRSSIKSTANTRQSPTIRDFFPKRESPLIIERPQSPMPSKGKLSSKKNAENTTKSVGNANAAINSNPPEKSARRARRKVTEAQITSCTSPPDNEGQRQPMKSDGRAKLQKLGSTVHPSFGEESQEVEMIMSRSILEPTKNVERNVQIEEAPKQQTKGRRGRKRLNPSESNSSNQKGCDTSSEASASEQLSFEVPVSKAKRAKMSNVNTTSVGENKSNRKKGGNTSSEASASEQPSFEVPVSKSKRAKTSNVSITSMGDNKISNKKGGNTSSETLPSVQSSFEVPASKSKRAKMSNDSITSVSENKSSNKRAGNTSSEILPSVQSSFEVPASKSKRAKMSNDSIVSVSESKSSNKRGGNSSSEASASEQPSFEVPASKPKRGRMSNVSITSLSDTSLTETSKKGVRSSRHSQRSLANSSTASSQSPSPSKTRQKVLFTGITNTNEYSKILAKLGASQVEETTKCTVLVTDKVRRTVKFLCALAQSTPIVSVEWLVDSEQMEQFVDMDAYILSDKESEKKFGFKLKTSLEKAEIHKLLDGYTIILTPNVAPPPIPDLKTIICACGGKPLVRPPTKWPEKAVIISNEGDMANARKFLAKAPKDVSVQSTEFLLTGILQQELNFTKFKLI